MYPTSIIYMVDISRNAIITNERKFDRVSERENKRMKFGKELSK